MSDENTTPKMGPEMGAYQTPKVPDSTPETPKERMIKHPTKVIVQNHLERPVTVSCEIETLDPLTENVVKKQVKVKIWPGEYPLESTYAEAALSHPWLKRFCEKTRGEGTAVESVFGVRPYLLTQAQLDAE